MQKKIAFALAIASLIISGISLFSVLGKADDTKVLAVITLHDAATKIQEYCPEPDFDAYVTNVEVSSRFLQMDVVPFLFEKEFPIRRIFIVFKSEGTRDGGHELLKKSSDVPRLLFSYFGSNPLKDNFTIDRKRQFMSLQAKDVFVHGGGDLKDLQTLATNRVLGLGRAQGPSKNLTEILDDSWKDFRAQLAPHTK